MLRMTALLTNIMPQASTILHGLAKFQLHDLRGHSPVSALEMDETGRLILFKECLKTIFIPFVINASRKAEYYPALNTAQTKQDYSLLERFFREEQAEYRQQVEGFPATGQRIANATAATTRLLPPNGQSQQGRKTQKHTNKLVNCAFSSRCDANTSHSIAPTPQRHMRSNRTGVIM